MNDNLHITGLSLDEGLVCDDPRTRTMARMATSLMHSEIRRFLNAERARPDFDAPQLLTALAVYFVQVHASLAANHFSEMAYPSAAALVKGAVEAEYVLHATRTSDQIKQKRGKQL